MPKVYVINCRDVGVNCDFETRGATIEEVMRHCAEHATQNHGMKAFGPELYAKMRACLRVEETA
jgi:predicted small metal-binding protein